MQTEPDAATIKQLADQVKVLQEQLQAMSSKQEAAKTEYVDPMNPFAD